MASPPSSTRSKNDATVIELYKLAVEMADRVSARRTTANGFFLTLHAALVAAVGLVDRQGWAAVASHDSIAGGAVGIIATSAAGTVLCAAWWLLLRSYRDLNRAKFNVITQLEERLPVALFTREWEFLKRDENLPWWRGRYAELGFAERWMPVAFGLIYIAAIIAVSVEL